MPRSLVLPFLGNLFVAVPGITALGLVGDGADYAVTGYTINDGRNDEAHTVELTFDADAYLSTEKDADDDDIHYLMTYKY